MEAVIRGGFAMQHTSEWRMFLLCWLLHHARRLYKVTRYSGRWSLPKLVSLLLQALWGNNCANLTQESYWAREVCFGRTLNSCVTPPENGLFLEKWTPLHLLDGNGQLHLFSWRWWNTAQMHTGKVGGKILLVEELGFAEKLVAVGITW